jgi:hypothetical protein
MGENSRKPPDEAVGDAPADNGSKRAGQSPDQEAGEATGFGSGLVRWAAKVRARARQGQPSLSDASKEQPTEDDSSSEGSPSTAPSGQSTEKDNEARSDRTGVVFLLGIVIWIGSAYFSSWLDRLHLAGSAKHWLVAAYVIVVILVVVATWAWVKHGDPTIQRITMFLLVVFAAALVILALIVLNPVERVLVTKYAAVAFLSMLPGLLYLQFIALRAETLRDEFVQNLHRLGIDSYENLPPPPVNSVYGQGDPPPSTDEQNLYIRKFETLYGRKTTKAGYALQVGNRLPLGLCTLVLAVGWAFVLQTEIVTSLSNFDLFSNISLSGRPRLPLEALRFGFIGSYFFVLQMLVRRYFQDDLRPSAYVTALQRVLVVALLITALDQVWPWSATQENAFAFIAGVFPDSALKALIELISKPLRPLVRSLEKRFPLSDLDGMNIWYESRLVEEGVEDMQSLATANLVDVILRTRVPVDRIVDWLDQSQLFLHVSNNDPGENRPSDREKLRILGIRTATDLEDAMAAVPDSAAGADGEFHKRLTWVLNEDRDTWPSVTESIVRSLRGEPNLYHVRRWKAFPDRVEESKPPVQVPAARPTPPDRVRSVAGGEEEVAGRAADSADPGTEVVAAVGGVVTAPADAPSGAPTPSGARGGRPREHAAPVRTTRRGT